MIDFLLNHLEFIIAMIIVIVGGLRLLKNFEELPNEEKEKQIKQWLLNAVLQAEIYYGSKTGRVKISKVWGAFCEQLPWAARYITIEQFEKYVDEALVEMRKLIESNKQVAVLVETKEDKEDKEDNK